jgi:cytosolic carboxypeptidase protein 2/3
MSIDCEFSGDENSPILDYPDSKSSYLYRHEQGGILVYDSSARISDEPILASDAHPRPRDRQKRAKTKVFDYGNPYADSSQYQSMPSYPKTRAYAQDYTIVIPDDSLRFSSRFECGNLKKAIRMHENEYNLQLEYDAETQGYTQWYYFSVRPYKPGHKVRFNITNLMKYESLYNEGMKPLTFSANRPGLWTRDCTLVCYFKNKQPRNDPARNFYTLTFTYTFEDPTDTVFFAYSYPYGHSDLMRYLESLQHLHPAYFNVNCLCKTLAGNDCPIVTITNNIFTYASWAEELIKLEKSAAGRRMMRIRESKANDLAKKSHSNKKCVFITARVHPGESNSSYMVKGLIDFLLGPSKEAAFLRKRFIFKIVPMLNPDGVIYGNYRCSLLGVDLNRRWDKPSKTMHPTIYYTKKMLEIVHEENEVILYCDMHGHSIKKDVFMYGCRSLGNDLSDKKSNVFLRLIPYLLCQKNSCFSFKSSKFRMEKSKSSTARIVNFSQFNILASYTIEASFYGCSNSSETDHLSVFQLESIGKDLCLVLCTLSNPRELRKKLAEITGKLAGRQVEPRPQSIVRNDLEEEISIKDAIEEIDNEAVAEISIEDEDSGGSDNEGSDADDKKRVFNEALGKREASRNKHHRKEEAVEQIPKHEEPLETCVIATPKSIRLAKDIFQSRNRKFKEQRSSSVLKEKSVKNVDLKPMDFTDDFSKIKNILRESPIKFTRDRIPHDLSLITIQKTIKGKKQEKKKFFEKRMKLQIISIIKNKLSDLL